jgi:hypothetical protein
MKSVLITEQTRSIDLETINNFQKKVCLSLRRNIEKKATQ